MGNINDLLQGSLNRLGIARQVEAVGVVEKATEEIAKYIPKEDFEVISFKDGILKISARSSVVAGEISYKKELILKVLKNHKTKEVRIKVN